MGGFVWVRLFSSGVGLGLMNMCNCSGAYPQYYNSYSSYQGYGGGYPQYYPQSYPQYSLFEGYGGMFPQYNNYSMGQYAGMMAYPVSGCGCGHSLPSVSTRGEYRVGSCLIICNR